MKVAIIGTAYPFRGGLSAFNERLALAYKKQGMEVKIFTFTTQYPNILFPGKSQYSDSPPPKNLNIVRVLSSINPFTWFKTANTILEFEPDLVICKFWLPFMGPAFGTILRRLRSKSQAKLISILDNVIPHEKRPGDKYFTRYFLKQLHGAIAMSQSVLDDFRIFEPKKSAILSEHPIYDNFGEAINPKEALNQLSLNPQCRYILFFGVIRDYKGLDLLIQAMNKPYFKNKGIKLLVAGEYYGNENYYKKLIKEQGLEDQIILHAKFIPDEDVKLYFCAADLIVQPYKSATQSGVTQIAYHFEKPMIVTKVGGLPEMCPDGKVGYIAEVSPESIGQKIIQFYEEGKNIDFKSHIQEEKKRYSWEQMVENIEKLSQS